LNFLGEEGFFLGHMVDNKRNGRGLLKYADNGLVLDTEWIDNKPKGSFLQTINFIEYDVRNEHTLAQAAYEKKSCYNMPDGGQYYFELHDGVVSYCRSCYDLSRYKATQIIWSDRFIDTWFYSLKCVCRGCSFGYNHKIFISAKRQNDETPKRILKKPKRI